MRHIIPFVILAAAPACASMLPEFQTSAPQILDVRVISKHAPVTAEPQVLYRSPTDGQPLFQFRFVKQGSHIGFPDEAELTIVKQEGMKLGAGLLILDCPGMGLYGQGACLVYGYEAATTTAAPPPAPGTAAAPTP